MREQFYNNMILRLSKILDEDKLNEVAKEIRYEINDYEFTKRCTELAVYEEMPECVKVYLVTRKMGGLKQSSLDLYHLRLKQFFRTVKMPLDKITTNDIILFLYSIQKESKHMSDRTLDNTLTIIKTFFSWANSSGYIPSNPCISISNIKYQRKERQSLTEDELEEVRNACDNLRDKMIVEVLYSTGCRVSELVNIKKSDINFEKREITVLGKGGKYRTVYLNPRAKMLIDKYLEQRTDDSPYLVLSLRKKDKITEEGVEHIFKRLQKKCNINKHIHPHLMRHTTASIGLKRGMDVTSIQKMLGHASLDTTMIYAHVIDNDVKNSHAKCIV